MRYHDQFEWDPRKAARNRGKHGVTFDDAARVLADEEADRRHLEEYDDEHSSDEDRQVTIAAHPDDRSIVLVIAWTDRSTPDRRITRIISARAATPHERRRYAEAIEGR
jgi:uncharacterized DUF497 family protein